MDLFPLHSGLPSISRSRPIHNRRSHEPLTTSTGLEEFDHMRDGTDAITPFAQLSAFSLIA